MPYFAQLGYPVVALNFRGAGAKDETSTNNKDHSLGTLHCFQQLISSIFDTNSKL
jgi:hypothetical protein